MILTPQEAILVALATTRVIALLMAFPFLNSNLVPLNVKIFLVLSLSFWLIKELHLETSTSFNFSLFWFLGAITKELLLGFSVGLIANIYIAAFSYSAELISYFMGFTVANLFDPTYGQVSILNKFFILLFYLLFFVSDAYLYFISAIALSLQTIPLGLVPIEGELWKFILEISGNLFSIAFKLAFPFMLILYLLNISLALVNRLIPQINVFIVGLPVQIFVGIAALLVGASVIVYGGVNFVQRMGEDFLYLIKQLG
ncbi:MAG: flagellar biosynthetic protein FliR [Epsilonproteobacteria bacterium]|nr:flagellar biosynthetic protein FliR [Campylobacterota bacterium]